MSPLSKSKRTKAFSAEFGQQGLKLQWILTFPLPGQCRQMIVFECHTTKGKRQYNNFITFFFFNLQSSTVKRIKINVITNY